MPLSLTAIAEKLSVSVSGDAEIQAVAAIEAAQKGDIAFVASKAYVPFLQTTQASAVIIKKDWQNYCSLPFIVCNDPLAVYAEVAQLLYPDTYTQEPKRASSASIHASAQIPDDAVINENVAIEEGVSIGKQAYIASNSVIQANVTIGDNVRIHPNVVVQKNCVIGDNVILHPGVVIGADGFGLARKQDHWIKIPQVGRVIIGNDVEVGGNTTIDRGANRDTIIEEGVKLDNLIQVAHNVTIGAHTAIAAKVGIAGSATIGKHCTIGGAAVILGHLSIADHTHIHAMSLVTNDIKEAGQYASGTPLEPVKQWRKNRARIKQLDAMAKQLKKLLK